MDRPFGDVYVNGFDFDIELNNGYSQYYPAMIATLRENFLSDPDHTYYITGAPQCPIPEPNMGVIIGNATFDYLWVQWYNNNNYSVDPCALPFNGNAPFNCEFKSFPGEGKDFHEIYLGLSLEHGDWC